MRNTNTTITIKSIDEVAPFGVDPATPRTDKENIIREYINPQKHEFLGFLDRTNNVVLRNRFHNVRDSYGRFAVAM